jgi:hypothetical protein
MYTGANIIRDGLVLALDAASKNSYPGTGTVWTDLSGNNNSGSLVNGPTYSSANGGSIEFNGTTNAMTTPLSLTPNNSTQNTWIYWNGINTSLTFSYIGNTSLNGLGMYISNSTDAGLGNKVAVLYGGIAYSATTNVISLIANVWTMVTVTRDTTTTTLYQNAIFIGSTASTPSNNTTTLSYRGVNTDPRNTSGITIATQSVYNRALSTNEIAQNYNATKSRFNL